MLVQHNFPGGCFAATATTRSEAEQRAAHEVCLALRALEDEALEDKSTAPEEDSEGSMNQDIAAEGIPKATFQGHASSVKVQQVS